MTTEKAPRDIGAVAGFMMGITGFIALEILRGMVMVIDMAFSRIFGAHPSHREVFQAIAQTPLLWIPICIAAGFFIWRRKEEREIPGGIPTLFALVSTLLCGLVASRIQDPVIVTGMVIMLVSLWIGAWFKHRWHTYRQQRSA